jgi:hypothetical protein
MQRNRFGIEICRRRRFQLEMAEAIRPPHQRRAILLAHFLADVRRQVPDRKTDATIVGMIGMGTVENLHVVQRHLARLQREIDGAFGIDIDGNLLARETACCWR